MDLSDDRSESVMSEKAVQVLRPLGTAAMAATTARLSPTPDTDPVGLESPEPMDASPSPSDDLRAIAGEGEGESASAANTRLTPAPVRRRNRPALSCIQCRSRKVKCSRSEPCSSCIKSKIVNCTYEEARRPKPKFWKLSPGASPSPGHIGGAGHHGSAGSEVQFMVDHTGRGESLQAGHPYSTSGTSSTVPPSSRLVEASVAQPASRHSLYELLGPTGSVSSSSDTSALAMRVRELEQKLADALKQREWESEPTSQPVPATLSKTRYFGASHWMNRTRMFPLIMSLAQKLEAEKNSDIYSALERCKQLGRLIKSQRFPASITLEVGQAVPAQSAAFRLVEAYLRTFESVYRILHVPTFWKDYQSYWSNPAGADKSFIIQLQLCMAIGTCFQDDVLHLRQSAAQWIYEAQYWLASPYEKSRMNMAGLQIMCLLHLAREACGVGGDLTWVSLGSTLRTAMFMGLHRDPEHLPAMPVLVAEMRRRLWATILEFILQSSLAAGGPPLLSVTDFDTRPPSNYDDEQLTETSRFATGPRPVGTYTQTSVQIALLKSFQTRLSIAQYVNDFQATPSYDETLRRNSELTIACRTLSATLQSSYDPAGVIPNRVSLFQLQMTEHMMHRFFLALNQSWMVFAQNNPAYYFARKMSVETSLKLYRSCAKGVRPADPAGTSQATDFGRLALAGAGAFRAVPLQALSGIVTELLWQAQDDRTFRQSMNMEQPGLAADPDAAASGAITSGVAPRAELLEALAYASDWTESRIRLGETNVKGYIFQAALAGQIEATQRGASDAEIERHAMERVLKATEHSLVLLKEIAGGGATPSDLSDFASVQGSSSADTDNFQDFNLGMNSSSDWAWVWDDMGFNMNNFNSVNLDMAFSGI